MANSSGFLGKQHADKTREKIKVTQIVHRLNSCALGEQEMSKEQIRAAEILLKKALPDLSSVSMTDGDGGPARMVIEWAKPSA